MRNLKWWLHRDYHFARLKADDTLHVGFRNSVGGISWMIDESGRPADVSDMNSASVVQRQTSLKRIETINTIFHGS